MKETQIPKDDFCWCFDNQRIEDVCQVQNCKCIFGVIATSCYFLALVSPPDAFAFSAAAACFSLIRSASLCETIEKIIQFFFYYKTILAGL